MVISGGGRPTVSLIGNDLRATWQSGRDRVRRHNRTLLGTQVGARDIYRDPVRSSKGHFVKASGLRWLSAMLLVQIPWAGRILALPFLTVLAPSKRFYDNKPRSPKTLLDCARQAVLQICRWLPDRYIVIVADSAFAALEFLVAVRNDVCVVTRLRLDASLYGGHQSKASASPSSLPCSRVVGSLGGACASVAGMAKPIGSSKSPLGLHSGIMPA
jgi:hypothetical protein